MKEPSTDMNLETATISRGIPLEVSAPKLYEPAKRAIDLLVSMLALIVLSPLLAICALAICLDSAGPVFFRQDRVGEGGRVFTMLKFRSMRSGADESVHEEYVTSFIRGEGELIGDEQRYKLVGDSRITRVGSWLRKTSLDELPQLFNVVRGEMSLVGPRPPISYEVEQYQPSHLRRLAVKPGITGLWQVSGRNTTTFDQMVELDVEYIRRRSVGLDIWIMLKTVPVILLAKDAC